MTMAMKKSLKQKLLEKLHKEHGIMLDPMDMISYRRNGFGSRIISWGTIKNDPPYQSFETMADCLKYPTKLERGNFGQDREITIEIDFEKIAAQISQSETEVRSHKVKLKSASLAIQRQAPALK